MDWILWVCIASTGNIGCLVDLQLRTMNRTDCYAQLAALRIQVGAAEGSSTATFNHATSVQVGPLVPSVVAGCRNQPVPAAAAASAP
jgi:hypothetical protein